tara:strand:+ start:2218 stop:3135 length:918 start_codon:yes stop_codon:yes gene_type:complete
MQLIVNGQQAFGKAVLEGLLERGESVCGVYCAPDQGTRRDPLKVFADENGLPVYQPTTYKDPAVWEQMRSLEADLCVMAYVTLMVPEEALNVPRLGSIQYHPSLLPMHKGPSSINWPIIMGESQTGLSIFWPDQGLDTGPILLQRAVEIGPDDTLGSLYFNHLFPMGVAAMLEAVDLVREGSAPRIEQDPAAGSYEGWCRSEDAHVDWSKSHKTVYDLIRGCNPQPGAWTKYQGQKLTILDSVSDSSVSGTPGTVIESDDDGITVAAGEGAIRVQKLKLEGGKKLTAAEFLSELSLPVGAALGTE